MSYPYTVRAKIKNQCPYYSDGVISYTKCKMKVVVCVIWAMKSNTDI